MSCCSSVILNMEALAYLRRGGEGWGALGFRVQDLRFIWGGVGFETLGGGISCGLDASMYPENRVRKEARNASKRRFRLLKGSWDLVSKVLSTLSGVISTYKYSYVIYL